MYLQTPGFILNAKKLREVDKVFSLFTEKVGKLEVQARGVRKILSKLQGHLQPFALIDFYLVHGKFRYQLIGATISKKFNVTGIINFAYGYYFLELVNKLKREQQHSREIYQLLLEIMEILEYEHSEENLKRLRVAFLLKMLKLTGFNPEERTQRDPATQASLVQYLSMDLKEINNIETNGELKKLFKISQYALNEVIEQPMLTVKFLQSI